MTFLFKDGDLVIATRDALGRFEVYPEPVVILGQVPSYPPMYVADIIDSKHNLIMEEAHTFSYTPGLLEILLELNHARI